MKNIIEMYNNLPISLGFREQIKDLKLFSIKAIISSVNFDEGKAISLIYTLDGVGLIPSIRNDSQTEFVSYDVTLDELFELLITVNRLGALKILVNYVNNESFRQLEGNQMIVSELANWIENETKGIQQTSFQN